MSATTLPAAPEVAAAPPAPRSRLVGDAGFAMAARIVYLVTRLMLPPLVLAHVSLAEYGLWAACFVIIGYIGLADLGLASAYVRFVSRLHARGDTAGIGRTLSTGIVSVGAVALAVFGALAAALPWVMDLLRIDATLRPTASMLILGTALVFMADMTLGAYAYVLHGLQRVRLEQQISLATCLVELALIVAFLELGWGVVSLLAAYALRYALSIGLAMRAARRLLPGLTVGPRQFDASLLREILGFGLRVQASTVLSMVLHSADRLLAGITLGPKAIALFDLGGKIPVAAMSVPGAITHVTLPAAAAIDSRAGDGARARLGELCLRASRAISLASALPMAFLAAFSLPICRAWLGERPDLAVLPLVMTLTAAAAHCNIITGPASAVFRSQGNVANEFVYHGLRVLGIAAGVGMAVFALGLAVPSLAWGVSGGIVTAATLYLLHSHRALGVPVRLVATRVLLPGAIPAAIASALAALWFATVPAGMGRWPALALLAAFGAAYLLAAGLALWHLLSAEEKAHLQPYFRRLQRAPALEN